MQDITEQSDLDAAADEYNTAQAVFDLAEMNWQSARVALAAAQAAVVDAEVELEEARADEMRAARKHLDAMRAAGVVRTATGYAPKAG